MVEDGGDESRVFGARPFVAADYRDATIDPGLAGLCVNHDPWVNKIDMRFKDLAPIWLS